MWGSVWMRNIFLVSVFYQDKKKLFFTLSCLCAGCVAFSFGCLLLGCAFVFVFFCF